MSLRPQNRRSVPSGELSTRADLASKINALISELGLTQNAAALRLSLPQPKVSAIRKYKLRGISVERLMNALVALDQYVEINITHARDETPKIEVRQ